MKENNDKITEVLHERRVAVHAQAIHMNWQSFFTGMEKTILAVHFAAYGKWPLKSDK